MENWNDREDDCGADLESDMELANTIKNPEISEQWNLSLVSNNPRFNQPTQKSMRQVDNVWVRFNGMETRRNKSVKQM